MKTHIFTQNTFLVSASMITADDVGIPEGESHHLPVLIMKIITSKDRDRPSIYHYYAVPETLYYRLISHQSPGVFFNSNIAGVFNSKKIN